jgi:hypothetical protein
MKYVFFTGLYFLLLVKIFAQTELEKTLNKYNWTNVEPEFKTNIVPEKWVNESAVILAFSLDYVYQPGSEKINIHYRVKLQDKAAVTEYSEMAFDKNISNKTNIKSTSYYIVGVKVIKPSGSEKELDLSKAVKTDAGSNKDLKIAVPDLEPGDIVDYYIAVKKESFSSPNFSENDILEERYPVVKRTISFKIPSHIHFYSYSYNGAPEFTKDNFGKENLYTLKDTMREKAPELLWSYNHRTSPEIRYRIAPASSTYYFGSTPNQKRIARDLLNNYDINYSDIGFIEDYMKGNFKDEKNSVKIVNEVYQLLRNPIYLKAYFNIEQGNPMEVNYVPELFFSLFSKYLLKRKISHEIIVMPARSSGPFDELIDLSSCELLIKVNTSPPLFISRPKPFTIVNELPYLCEGMKGVSKGFLNSEDLPTDTDSLRISSPEDNSTLSKLNVKLNEEDNSKINVKRNVLSKGYNKNYHQHMVFTNYDYLKEYDLPKFQVQSSHLFRDLLKQNNIEKQKFEQRLKQDYDERDARIKKDLETEMDVQLSDYKNLSVKSIGMWDHTPNVEYTDEFTLENLTRKAGSNLIIELGRLIEKQTEVKELQRVRTRDIYMPYPREFLNEIALQIPEGYAVEGLEKFNKKISNNQGGFVSAAWLEGNTLMIRTKKYYNKNYSPASEWPKILEFLDAAVEFHKEKILLKKK